MSTTRLCIVSTLITAVSFLLAGQVSAGIGGNNAGGETEPAEATQVTKSSMLLAAEGTEASGDSSGTDDSDEPDCD